MGLERRRKKAEDSWILFFFFFKHMVLDQLGIRTQGIQEMWVRSLGQENPPEEGMTIHFTILAWRIPWTEEPGGLQFTELQSWTQLKQLSVHTRTQSTSPFGPISATHTSQMHMHSSSSFF